MALALIANRFDEEAREVIPAVLSRTSAKVISFHTAARERTVRGWQQGMHLPGPGYLFALSHLFPEIADLVERHRALTGARHPALIAEREAYEAKIAKFVSAHEPTTGEW